MSVYFRLTSRRAYLFGSSSMHKMTESRRTFSRRRAGGSAKGAEPKSVPTRGTPTRR